MKRTRNTKFEGTILVADDHEVVRYGLVQLLRREFGPRQVVEASAFDEVEKAMGLDDLKLVICDLTMPGLKGPQQLSVLRRRRPDVKVVVLSGNEERQTVLDALMAGVHGYFLKSGGNDRLIERLTYVLGGEIYVPPLVATLQAVAAPARVDGERPASPQPVPTSNGAKLSGRQKEVLSGLVRGLSNKEIARELHLAEGTVKMHVGAVLRVLGASNRAHAAAIGQHLLR